MSSSLAVIVAVLCCLCVSTAHSIDKRKVSGHGIHSDIASVAKTAQRKYQNDVALQESACDCGKNSKGCKMENGTKVCDCEWSFRQENGICKAFCEETWRCDNGAKCVDQSCQCLPGTSGDFCEQVDACEGIKGPLMCGDPDKVLCMYDSKTQKPYCMCRIMEYQYYAKNRTCIECNCSKYGSCSLVDGKKQCKCNEGTAIRKVSFWGDIVDRCDACNCGNNSDGCSFDGLYTKVCNCKEGFSQQPDLGGDTCNECSCGPNGQCFFKGWYKNCKCDEGYQPFLNMNRTDVTCKACDCGKNGECSFEKEVKQCKCNPGYAERDGICTACQCYLGNETVPCTFPNKIQKCLCPEGYEATKFFCIDIDECQRNSNICPSTTDCVNTIGSYDCVCKEGYELLRPGSNPKLDGCHQKS